MSVYQINKGVNASIEFKGLKAHYIGYFAVMLLVLLILFAILYIMGISIYICVAVIGGTGSYGAFKLNALSHRYGTYGMMKFLAHKRLPKTVRAYTRKLFY